MVRDKVFVCRARASIMMINTRIQIHESTNTLKFFSKSHDFCRYLWFCLFLYIHFSLGFAGYGDDKKYFMLSSHVRIVNK